MPLSVSTIVRALAVAAGLESRHAVKQVDRLLSKSGVEPWRLFASWVPFVVADRKETNTAKHRTLSLLNQGLLHYAVLPMMKVERAEALMAKFGEMLREQRSSEKPSAPYEGMDQERPIFEVGLIAKLVWQPPGLRIVSPTFLLLSLRVRCVNS